MTPSSKNHDNKRSNEWFIGLGMGYYLAALFFYTGLKVIDFHLVEGLFFGVIGLLLLIGTRNLVNKLIHREGS